MSKRRLRNAGNRPKAFLGMGESAAILTAAGINAATQLTAAGMNAAAAKDSAQRQAQATIQGAQRQAEAIKDQSIKSKELQQESQDFIKEENAENRELQNNIQMQLQMLTGQQNVNDRLEASKIKVKAGGSTKRRLRYAGGTQFLLRGGNMPFEITDGGGVLPVGVTPEGYDLYEILGNDHEHYHKTRGGKYKSGVGIKFADGNVVEGEGNQKKNGGELMLVTPDNAYFISKHSINGFNPAEGVKQGLHPLQAYAIQEQEKDAIGLNDDGTKKVKLGRKFLAGGTPVLYNMNGMNMLNYSSDTIGDTAVGVAYNSLKNKEEFKYGGKKRCLRNGGRVKAKLGDSNRYAGSLRRVYVNPNTSSNTYSNSGTGGGIQPKQSFWNRAGNWINNNADWLGVGINGLANIGGAFITSAANRAASNLLSDAYTRSAGIMRDAYNSLPLIDMNSIRREDYAAAHMMPVFQAPVSFADSQVAIANRSLQRRLRNAGRYSASSAAAQNRMAEAEVDTQDIKNKIYSADQQQMQKTREGNVERATEASRMNAYLDTKANQQYSQDRLKLLQYNNDTEKEKILGAAGALSEGSINSASAIAQGRTANAAAWSSALGNIGLTASNTLSTMAKRRANFENTMLGATTDAQINQIARNGSLREKQARLAAVQAAIRSGRLSPDDEAKYRYYEELLSKSL